MGQEEWPAAGFINTLNSVSLKPAAAQRDMFETVLALIVGGLVLGAALGAGYVSFYADRE